MLRALLCLACHDACCGLPLLKLEHCTARLHRQMQECWQGAAYCRATGSVHPDGWGSSRQLPAGKASQACLSMQQRRLREGASKQFGGRNSN